MYVCININISIGLGAVAAPAKNSFRFVRAGRGATRDHSFAGVVSPWGVMRTTTCDKWKRPSRGPHHQHGSHVTHVGSERCSS